MFGKEFLDEVSNEWKQINKFKLSVGTGIFILLLTTSFDVETWVMGEILQSMQHPLTDSLSQEIPTPSTNHNQPDTSAVLKRLPN